MLYDRRSFLKPEKHCASFLVIGRTKRGKLSFYFMAKGCTKVTGGFPGGSVVKTLPANAGDAGDAGDTGSVSGLGRSSRVENGNSLQYFLPGKFHGQRSLTDNSTWGCK